MVTDDIAWNAKLCLPPHSLPLMTIVFGYERGLYPPMPPKLPAEQVLFGNHYYEPDRDTMKNWLSQMRVGYKVSHLASSFESQIEFYRRKLVDAEEDLQKIVFYQRNVEP